MDNEQISFFGNEDETKAEDDTGNLNVVRLDFIEGLSMKWQELFSGFDTIKAITFSSGINFMAKLLDLFEEAETIFGCERIMSYSLNEVMAFQTVLLEHIRSDISKDKLIERINNGTIHMLVTRTKISHEKIYLLSDKDGRKRVIMGSANMSDSAFSGRQRENISFVDGEEAYNWYLDIYNNLKDDCTDEITGKAIAVADCEENIGELPVSQTAKSRKVLAIVPDTDINEDVEFALDISRISADLKPMLPKSNKKGKIMLSPATITTMRSHICDAKAVEREKRREFPQFIVDTYNSTATLNGKKFDLSPSKDEIKNDVLLFIQYMNGYEMFHGNYKNMQRRYFEFANWFFCSPFMGIMRDTANRYNQNTLPYPIFGLIYGQSKAGKTSFLETLLIMMIGRKTKIPASDFTRKNIEGLRYEVKGAPIIVDDLTKKRFDDHAVETIKNDMFGFSDKNINYPVVVISANEDLKNVTQEIIRRTIICHVSAGLTNTEVMKSNTVRKVQKNISTAFYREYLRRMFEKIPELIENMKDDEAESAPDILELSSNIIYDIFSEVCEDELPDYIRRLTLMDYFGEKVTASNVITTIKNAWNTSKEQFVVDKKKNILQYNAGQTYDAARIIKELPETLEPKQSREWVMMNFDEAKKFFEVDFKISFFDRFKK
ncbi:MAG: phospholipase D family protein [Ruminococcus flavefaciens]|nr:phospholipase D family protein [Ruminococcus flavefaciens]